MRTLSVCGSSRNVLNVLHQSTYSVMMRATPKRNFSLIVVVCVWRHRDRIAQLDIYRLCE